MSRSGLRSKRSVSPSVVDVQPKLGGPGNKRTRKNKTVEILESDSSSDEFLLPPANLKVKPNAIAVKNGLAAEPDFSAIEKSIFSGVSRLSESDSGSSDFEEVSCVPASSIKRKKAVKDAGPQDTSLSVENIKDVKASPLEQQTRSMRGRNTKKKSEEQVAAVNKSPDSTNGINLIGRVSRSSKRRPSPVESETVSDQKRGKMKKKNPDPAEDIEAVKSSSRTVKGRKQDVSSKQKSVKRKDGGDTGNLQLKQEKQDKDISVKKEVQDSVDSLNVAQLLALGEGFTVNQDSTVQAETDSDEWEEVDPSDVKKHEIPKEGVQITLDLPEFSWRRKKHDQQACLQAEMNRAFNRVRRELQLLCHKTSLLLWLAHGIFLNRCINNDGVRAMALSLIPSDLCQLPKAPGRKYLNQILKWFGKEFECSEGFPESVEKGLIRPLTDVLEQHFSRRYAKSTKELTLMFVTILRALGMEGRLIISFQPVPLKPQSDELLAINKKSKSDKNLKKEHDPTTDSTCKSPDSKSISKKLKDNLKKSFESQTEFSSKPLKDCQGEAVDKSAPKKAAALSRKSAPHSSLAARRGDSSKNSKQGRKSEQDPPKSPSKSPSKPQLRQLRGNRSKKVYKEVVTDDEDLDEECLSPILSPGEKKGGDKESINRLKAAAAKRVPASIRRSEYFPVPGPSKTGGRAVKDSDNDSDFETNPKLSSSRKGKRKFSPPNSSASQSQSQESESESDFESKPKPKPRQSIKAGNIKKTPSKGRPSKAASSNVKDDDSCKKQVSNSATDYWAEVYLHDEEKWTCVDVPSGKVDSTKAVLAKATQPVCYVIAFNVEGTLKDVTKRYAPKFSQVTSKQRISADWWIKTLKPFVPKHSGREAAEDSEMNMVELDRPMPKSVGECKNHPLYVLKRHLLKFEAIYPPDSPSLGFVRGEPIYARQNVYTLHSREIWMKDAKVVRPGEVPYKIVKARPKYDRLSGKVITDLPLEIFGPWQVEDYVPPPAVDGKVPRNAYGNVELFKPTMLPKGCTHLQVPGLSRVAKKLRIDCAPAVVGFDYHSGGCHPTYGGFVVCDEFVDVLMDAWNKEIDESAKRREEKHEKRVYGNWRRLIKGLLIREQLKYRYDFKGEVDDQVGSSQPTVNVDALKASRIVPENQPLPFLFPKLMATIRSQKGPKKKSTTGTRKQTKPAAKKQEQKAKSKRRRRDETSEEEESEWDSTTTEEDEGEMVLLSDEDSGSDFENLKTK